MPLDCPARLRRSVALRFPHGQASLSLQKGAGYRYTFVNFAPMAGVGSGGGHAFLTWGSSWNSPII